MYMQLATETHMATLHKGRIELEGRGKKGSPTLSFPEKSCTTADVTCIGLTLDFLVYGTMTGSLFYFSLQEHDRPLPVTEYCHATCGISRIWLNPFGSRLIFEDESHFVFLYNPLNDQVLPITEFTGVLEAALWDANNDQIFVLVESQQNFVYIYSHTNIWGPSVTFLGASARPLGFQATALQNGILNCKDAFLRSCCLEAALEMRCNLQQWEQALPLAIELGGSSALDVKIEYAKLLEMRGEQRRALAQYESLLDEGLNASQLLGIKAGVARTSIHCGDPWKGRQMALQCDDTSLYTECAHIFENMKLFEDAGDFFKLGGQLEKSATCFISIGKLTKAFSLLDNLASPKYYVEYAKAMEKGGNFADAIVAYESAEDHENVVRLLLGPLQNPSKAFSVALKAKSIPGAFLAARFCKSTGDYAKAIEFLILSRRSQEAKELAEQHHIMDVYTELAVDITSKDECLQLARYYETLGDYCKAGTLLERFGHVDKALKLYLCWGDNGGIEQAINLVGREKSDMLINQLFDYLNIKAENGGGNNFHVYMLHKALGNYDEAAKLVAVLAGDEQEKGNYKRAHQLLLDISLLFQNHGKPIPPDVLKQLILLHSYVLGKIRIRLGDHSSGSQLLIRVARNIVKFPAHVVPILTSTVLECHRSGLKSTAFEFASMLMCPEYRNLISSSYKRQVEKIVRKCEKVEEKEPLTPCPFCASLLPNMQLHCNSCHNDIPFCIASGRHMVLGDWSVCPHCKFPALASELIKVVERDSACPMCCQKLSATSILCMDVPDVQKTVHRLIKASQV